MLSVVPGAHNRPRGSRGIGADRACSDRMNFARSPSVAGLDWTGPGGGVVQELILVLGLTVVLALILLVILILILILAFACESSKDTQRM